MVETSGGSVIGGVPLPANLTISGSATQIVDISAKNYIADNGVVPSDASCSYDGGEESPCSFSGLAAPAGGKTLLVGVTVAVDSTQYAGTGASPSFEIEIKYH